MTCARPFACSAEDDGDLQVPTRNVVAGARRYSRIVRERGSSQDSGAQSNRIGISYLKANHPKSFLVLLELG